MESGLKYQITKVLQDIFEVLNLYLSVTFHSTLLCKNESMTWTAKLVTVKPTIQFKLTYIK